MKNYAVIPARAGSRRLPGKNKMLFHGKPLIEWTVDAAWVASIFNKIVVSTDDPDIVEMYERDPRVQVSMRPPELAGDTATTFGVIEHEVAKFTMKGNLCVLQPTSPLRESTHILDSFRLYENVKGSVVSVVLCAKKPEWTYSLDQGSGMILPLENTCELVTPNGAIYWSNIEDMLSSRQILSGSVYAFEMSPLHSVDIDVREDFELAFAIKDRRDRVN